MKTYYASLALVLVYLGFATHTFSQTSPNPSSLGLPNFFQISDKGEPDTLASGFRIDFAVPDAPAFQLLESESSDILRPSSVREFATSFSSFVNADQGFSIPKTFAIEFSPGLLIGGNRLTLKGYRARSWLYRSRLSAGIKRLDGETGPSQIAIGFRTSIIDESDLRQDTALMNDIAKITGHILQIAKNQAAPPPLEGGGAEIVKLTGNITIDSLNQALTKRIADAQADQRWNKEALDVAGAVLLVAQDSLGQNLRSFEIAGWITYATGLGTSWGQLLIGSKLSTKRDSVAGDLGFSGSVSTRLYIGANSYKVFAETQFKKQRGSELLSLNGGGEARLARGVWFSFGGGVERNFDQKKWNVLSKFSIKLGLPFVKEYF